MKINFIGLSSFLIENDAGFRLLVDPFNDAPEWRLGPRFPTHFNGKPFGANIVLMSEPDADHAYTPGGWLQEAPPTKPNSNPFPKIDLRGTVVYEWNGDVNIAWQYTIDGIRCAHFADNAHELTKEQLDEIGHPDVIFISAPKADSEASMVATRKNIELLQPKVVVWAHHLAPKEMPDITHTEALRAFFLDYFSKYANTNTSGGKEGGFKPEGFMPLCTVLENAWTLNKELNGRTLSDTSFEVTAATLQQVTDKPDGVLFLRMLSAE